MKNLTELLTRFKADLEELKSVTGYISFRDSLGEIDILMNNDKFKAMFPNYETTPRDCEIYPYELSETVKGVKFFALTKEVTP